ncbi:MAG: type II toxin-antitoxin system RelB/DinJ family antitoxin [Patescibacteria group bacterium]|nr:type II toxin-antitoxin system RelB/DinJ family antitoxin [Patescibacteria group bacterium]MDE2588068.1 type II toxin-antitoxin system RelB/DinJ family antitoxin [Patescibacteria group bacterium]
MNTTSLHIKVEPDLKEQAQSLADELGISLSAVVKALLKQFVRTKHLSVGIDEIPNDYLIRSIKQSDEDIKNGRVTSFASGQDVLSYLDQEIKIEKERKHAR